MADDAVLGPAPSSSKAGVVSSSGVSHGVNVHVPPGYLLRRSKTVDETSLSMRTGSMSRRFSSDSSSEPQPRRSSSVFSEYSLNEARDILNPRPHVHGAELAQQESSSLASLSLAFALLPAIAGVLFKNGSSVVTDVMLLGLAAVFLHWSVTQPWQWYHAAQEVRIQEENNTDTAVDDDSDIDPLERAPASPAPLDDVPEEEEEDGVAKPGPQKPEETREVREKQKVTRQQAALKELYRYEVLALCSCFVLPLLSAYLLHAIRSQLSRPSEGIVSNFNLTIFLLASELRVFSHMIKLVQSRTLHLQRIVHESSFGRPASFGTRLDEVLGRLERLEALSTTKEQMLTEQGVSSDSTKATLARDVRNTIQPELDALNRAVRRYEKKATLLQLQTESRFSEVNTRLDDAIALAAAAAKNTTSRQTLLTWMAESITIILLLPFNALLQILALPLKPIVALGNRNKRQPPATGRAARSNRTGKPPMQVRYSDRVPTRVAKK